MQPEPTDLPRRLVATIVAVVLVGLTATGLLANALANRDARARAIAIDARTREAGERVDASIRRAFDAAVAVRGLVGHRPETGPEAFREFVVDGGVLQGFPRVSAISFARWDPERDGVFVELIEPLEPNAAAIGFDLTSESTRRIAVERARDDGVPAASAPIPLIQDPDGPPGVLLVLPVYANGQDHATGPERRRNFLGVASMVLRADVLLSSVLPADSTIDLRVEDIGTLDQQAPAVTVALLGSPGEADATTSVNVGDRRWRLTGSANDRFRASTPAWLIVLIGGMALTAVGAVLVWSMGSARTTAERIVQRRTIELQTANAALLEADQAKSAFLATVSHELRTPLTAIIGFLAILRRRNSRLTEDQRVELLHRMDRNSHSLLGLIEDLLSFSRLEDGAADLQPEVVDLDVVVNGALDALAPLLDGATVERRMAPGIAVIVDPRAVDRIVTNLVTNAVKYAGPAPHVVVELTAGQFLAELTVTDDGPGIPLEERELIFRRFERGSTATSTRGTGIGLAVVRELARRNGGDVWLDPSPRGASFRVGLPVTPPEASATETTNGAPKGADVKT